MAKLLSFERSATVLGLLVLVTITSSGQTSPTKPESKLAAPTNSKIALNTRPMGTTDNSAELTNLLKQVFKQRRENFVFKPGTTEVLSDVYLKADPAIGLQEVEKIIDVVREAGSLNVLFPIEVPAAQAGNLKPNPLTLMVTIGEPKPDLQKVLVDGIKVVNGMTLRHEYKLTISKELVALFVPKDGEYMISDKPVAQAALTGELTRRMKLLADAKRVHLIIDNDGDVRYRSLAAIAHAAYDAGVKEIYFITLKD